MLTHTLMAILGAALGMDTAGNDANDQQAAAGSAIPVNTAMTAGGVIRLTHRRDYGSY